MVNSGAVGSPSKIGYFTQICPFQVPDLGLLVFGLAQFRGKIRAKYQPYQVFISMKKCNTKIRAFLVSKYPVIHFMKGF